MTLTVAGAVIATMPVVLAFSLVPGGRDAALDVTRASTVAQAIDVFKDRGFDPEAALREGAAKIPPVYLASLPGDLKSVRSTHLRKALFVSVVLPHVLKANERIRQDRVRLARLQRADRTERTIRGRDRKWLGRMAKKYRTKPMDFDELLRRVDTVPPRLAIAQAAQESGWGTSRFARAGNALFGQHAPDGAGAMTALGDRSVTLKSFDNLHRSVLDYMRNLNSNPAYEKFRDMRAQMRGAGLPVDAVALAGSLDRYSEEGALYVERLRTVMSMPEVAAARGARLAEQ